MTVGQLPAGIVRRFREFARAERLLHPGPLLVAVSGGTDSTALLLLLAAVSRREALSLHVAHFDHLLRPAEATADAEFVAGLAERFEAQIHLGKAAQAARSEDGAREARYEFLRRAAAKIGAQSIATGHTKDDQAETVLLHATRGAGLGGLAGIRARNDGLIRPLLALRRADTVAVCAALEIEPREDSSNGSLEFARNRIRHRVLPELALINPRVVDSLARLGAIAAEANADLKILVTRALAEARVGDEIDLDRLPAADGVRSETLAAAWKEEVGRSLTAAHRFSLLAESRRRDGSSGIDLPGGRAERRYATIRFIGAGRIER